jgi:hypothetical protein
VTVGQKLCLRLTHPTPGSLQVAILCNHQRSVPKTHDNQMKVMQEKLDAMRQELQVR